MTNGVVYVHETVAKSLAVTVLVPIGFVPPGTAQQFLFGAIPNKRAANPVVNVCSQSSPLHQFLCGLNASPDDKKVEESEGHECHTSESMV